MRDFLFRGSLVDLDLDLYRLTQLEKERQYYKLILIPSESTAPLAVREALSSAFQNVYAEGYPAEEMRGMSEAEILDYDSRLGYHRRYSDSRYYKGVEYANILEALTRQRCADVFAANGVSAGDIFVNVQPLSGAPANNAVYHALVNPGDTIMGLNLLHGGHLTHGSSVTRSGKFYNAVHYSVDTVTEHINYDAVEELANLHKPKLIIAGYSAYPWTVDWGRFRDIANNVGAYLLADISHVAGLVAAGEYPSPIGFADVITFTTHKSLCGPRGACILTCESILARKIDRAVFPGEQGGPHVNVFAAMAVAFKLARTDQFRDLQRQVVKNCIAFTERFKELGFRIPYGGTNTHLMNLDCRSVSGPDGTTLSGEQAARILDLAGIVVNRNTIPGDKSAARPSGIRMGTPWVTQRGFKRAEMRLLADIIADVMRATIPYSLMGRKRAVRRAKVDFKVLEETKKRSRRLAKNAGIDFEPSTYAYPHLYYLDDYPESRGWSAFTLTGDRVRGFLNYALASDVEALDPGQNQVTLINTPLGMREGTLACVSHYEFRLNLRTADAGLAVTWLRDLSDGFVAFDDDPLRKLPGPIVVRESSKTPDAQGRGDTTGGHKPYYIGISRQSGDPLPKFTYEDKEYGLRRTPIFDTHLESGAKIITFAGWEMPVWYTSVRDEHLAVRQASGLFDVTHMGVFQAEGPDAAIFLDCVVGNDIGRLEVGESCYTHFLDPDANVIDDLLVYRRGREKFMIVVNAANDSKDWAWLTAVKEGKVKVDNGRPCSRVYGRKVTLRNLRDSKEGDEMRVDIALQGQRSREVLLALGCDDVTRKLIKHLIRTQLCEVVVGGFDLIVSRTGYTGEKMAFELFVHPDLADELFRALLKCGESFGLKPVGLGARDSLRTEAGLPLYGHEMGGERNLGVAEGGFGSYVKTYKPWFIGRESFLAREAQRKGLVVRFRFNEKSVRMAHNGDPVMDKRGRVIGWVTSCALDSDGFLTGQAFVGLKYSEKGRLIFVFQGATDRTGKAPAELVVGDRITLPTLATVVSRFR